ncbi:hypothetical protein X949_5429 [Burkholderia pseudomallei MSHR5609]|nr:hypothetical protein X949_5429 [Burkholderia pseudomallei MSHR5609]
MAACAARDQVRAQHRRSGGDRQPRGVDREIGGYRRFVRRGHAGEVRQQAAARLAIQPFRIAPLAFVERRAHVNLAEPVAAHDVARHRAIVAKRRDQRSDDDEPDAVHQPRDLGGAPDVLVAVFGAEAEIAVQPVAQVIAVEHRARPSIAQQQPLQFARERRLARAAQAGEPQRERRAAELGRARVGGDAPGLPEEILRR